MAALAGRGGKLQLNDQALPRPLEQDHVHNVLYLSRTNGLPTSRMERSLTCL